jgi:flagellar protein FlaG
MDITGVNRSTAVLASAPAAQVDQKTQHREIIQAVKALNSTEMFGENNEAQFQKDPLTNRMVVRIIDRKTKEVISQIPAEYLLQLAAESKSQK